MAIRTLVVGCGSIGSRHARNLSTFQDVDVVAYDVKEERAVELADEIDAQTTSSLKAAFDSGVDCVLVCTPPDTHIEIASEALGAGADVFVEKPLSDSVAGTDEFVAEVESSEQIVYVACNMRFHPPVITIREWLEQGELGKLQFLRLRYGNDIRNWRPTDYRDSYSSSEDAGGGIVRDGVHELDLAMEWLGPFDTIYCGANTVGDHEMAAEDTAEILLESDAQMAEIHLDAIRPERVRTYELIGSEALIRWVGRGKDPEFSRVGLYRRDVGEWQWEEFDLTLNEQYVAEMQDFLRCVRDRTPPEMNARRGRAVLDVAERARRSAANNSPVDAPVPERD